MPEALTESFCERCGTRYEFEAPTQLNTLRRTRGLVSGFKNYLLSQDALSDSIGDAMRAEEQDLASAQLEAFHAAFNFCINCRQYACNNCWNDADGRCRTCAPIPGTDDLVERMEEAYRAERARSGGDTDEVDLDAAAIQRRLGSEAWPSSDLVAEADASATAPPETLRPAAEPAQGEEWAPASPPMLAGAGPQETVGPEPVPAAAEVEFTPILGWEADVGAEAAAARLESDLAMEVPAAPPAAAQPSLPPALNEPPAHVPPVPAEPVSEPAVAAEPPAPAQPTIDRPLAEPRPLPAEPAPPEEPLAPEPTPIRRRPVPLSETFVRRTPRPAPPREPAPVDDAALAARRAQLELLGIEDPGEGRVGTGQRPALAYRSSGAAVHRTEAQAAGADGDVPTPLWDASAREVAAGHGAVAVQSCGSCGLSLSANARFCRRCGSRQARSA